MEDKDYDDNGVLRSWQEGAPARKQLIVDDVNDTEALMIVRALADLREKFDISYANWGDDDDRIRSVAYHNLALRVASAADVQLLHSNGHKYGYEAGDLG